MAVQISVECTDISEAHPRFLNYHGEYGARLERGCSVHGSKNIRSWILTLLAPLLFGAPYSHVRSLEKIWVDSTIAHLPWMEFVTELKTEWQRTIISVC